MKRTYCGDPGPGRRAVLALSLAAVLAMILATAPGRPAEATFPGANGKIAFERFGDLYLADEGGTDAQKIDAVGSQANPAISSDGTRIAYEYGRGIWVMNADGTGQKRVSNGTNSTTFADSDPAWSPDGRRVVFSRYEAGDSDLWGANLDGTDQENLTNTPDHDEMDPSWSPAGDEIAYTRVGCDPPQGGMSCVFTMNADGGAQTNLTPEDRLPGCLNQPGYQHRGASSEPSWSPDGAKIAFRGTVTCPHSSGSDIWVMGSDGGGKTNVTDDNGTGDNRPAYAPDGTRIAFNSSRPSGSATAVYLIGTDGGTPARLAASTGFDHDPDWGPVSPTPVPAVTNTNDTGRGSLRQAILEANATAQADTIAFDIPGTGARTIAPVSPLPQVTSPVTIDGTTQPGYAGKPIVVLSGANAGADASGLDLQAGNSTVKSLVVNRFGRSAISVSGNGGNAVEGCYLGTDVSGTQARGNGNGVNINDSASNRIGGSAPGQGNVISGNRGYGVNVEGDFGQNTVAGNLIGTDASGTVRLGNAYSGVRLGIGIRGTSVSGNVVSANGAGVEFFGYEGNPLRNNTVRDNRIGTDETGTKDLGNSGYGVRVAGAKFSDVLDNKIAFNGASGVGVLDGDGTRISRNSIHDNAPDDPSQGLGVDLGGDGVTANDAGDADGGPNGLQNHPVLSSARTIGGATIIKGTLSSTPNTAFGIELFSSPKADPSGFGEGRTPLLPSATSVTTDGSGEAAFTHTTEEAVPPGHVVTATALPNDQASGSLSTSEFSKAVPVTADDLTAPNTAISSAPPALTRSASASFAFASTETNSGFECGLDGAPFAPCASPKAYSGLPSGAHTFRVRARDAAGNVDASPAVATWKVDPLKPAGRVLINGGTTTTRSRKVSLKLSAVDPAPASGVGHTRFSHNGRTWTGWQAYARSKSWKLTAGAGTKTVHAQYRDRAGNVSAVARDAISYRP